MILAAKTRITAGVSMSTNSTTTATTIASGARGNS